MVKISMILFVAALAYTSVKAGDDDDQQLGSPDWASQPKLPAFDEDFAKDFATGFKKPSVEDIKNLKPHQPGEHVAGHFSSFSTSKQVINGQVVKDEKKAEEAVNKDGNFQDASYSN